MRTLAYAIKEAGSPELAGEIQAMQERQAPEPSGGPVREIDWNSLPGSVFA
ncbi:MAG: hypothetical protein E6063_07290 [Atopobium sp.]|nr:hypothetical protein [Atopobium sp.]